MIRIRSSFEAVSSWMIKLSSMVAAVGDDDDWVDVLVGLNLVLLVPVDGSHVWN